MATAAPGRTRSSMARLRSLPVFFILLAVVVFVFYQFVLGGLVSPVQSFFDDWLPLTSVNQCLIWAMLAVGLNIVVGYAGLLDLGYVAFWAIGGDGAGGGMLPVFSQGEGNKFRSGAPRPAGGAHPQLLLLRP